ncbi:DUF4352 domain-containing protein [Streptomyces xanthii]|uniref:DUF4352 domain-containing protein n=1 Tax=Streptomyces xanthii TaxID=2768069 RepID=A0A7H1BB89_9ACTN|nr:DUF4352 domain-containing protein [Streptomyces xanthii]QNS05994.1 DUF4352 domain-containing protein [Streptomyces xanthii]
MGTRPRTLIAAGATLGALALAGCSNGSDADSGASASPASAASSEGADAGAPPGAEILGITREGEPFKVTVTFSDGSQPAEFRITVDGVTCDDSLDPKVLAYAADSVGASATESPVPESGKQFCVVLMNVENVGKSRQSWDAGGTVGLNVRDTQYTETQQEAEYALDYAQYANSQGRPGATFGLNPGSHGPAYGVFEIPAGDEPTSLWVTSGTAITTIDGVEPGYLVRLE